MNWSDERVEMLKKLWADGLSASQIAAELGGVTRNAVISKVHRLGLAGRERKSEATARNRPHRAQTAGGFAEVNLVQRISRPAIRGNLTLVNAYEHSAEPEPEASEIVDNIIPIRQRRTILELTEETCRWPIGDPGTAEFFFCGGQTTTSLPYCSYHSLVAYRPPNSYEKGWRPYRNARR